MIQQPDNPDDVHAEGLMLYSPKRWAYLIKHGFWMHPEHRWAYNIFTSHEAAPHRGDPAYGEVCTLP